MDLSELVKLCTPTVTAALGAWGLYLRTSVKSERLRVDRERACEEARDRDAKDCREKHERLETEIVRVRDEHMRESRKSFDRLADAMEDLVRHRRRRDEETDQHHAKKG